MSQQGPFLYDEEPEPRSTGTPRSRRGLLVVILLGTVLVAVAAVVALPLVKGSPGEQASEVTGVFVAALQQDDVETAYQLLCRDERARLRPDAVAGEYLQPGSATIADADDAERGGRAAQRVEVRWTAGDAVTSTFVTVVNEDGAHVCGTTPAG